MRKIVNGKYHKKYERCNIKFLRWPRITKTKYYFQTLIHRIIINYLLKSIIKVHNLMDSFNTDTIKKNYLLTRILTYEPTYSPCLIII